MVSSVCIGSQQKQKKEAGTEANDSVMQTRRNQKVNVESIKKKKKGVFLVLMAYFTVF